MSELALHRIVISLDDEEWSSWLQQSDAVDLTRRHEELLASLKQEQMVILGTRVELRLSSGVMRATVLETIPWNSGTVSDATVVVVTRCRRPVSLHGTSNASSSFVPVASRSPVDAEAFVPSVRVVVARVPSEPNHRHLSEFTIPTRLRLQLGLPDGSVVCIMRSVFCVVRDGGMAFGPSSDHHDVPPTVSVSPSLWTGIFNAQIPRMMVGGCAKKLRVATETRCCLVPLDDIEAVWSSELKSQMATEASPRGRSATYTTLSTAGGGGLKSDAADCIVCTTTGSWPTAAVRARKIVVVPVHHDAYMVHRFGSSYADWIAAAVQEWAPTLHGQLVFEDMVLRLPVFPSSSQSRPVWESELAQQERRCVLFRHLYPSSSARDLSPGSIDSLDLRIALVGNDTLLPWGVVVSAAGEASPTEIVLASSASHPLARDVDAAGPVCPVFLPSLASSDGALPNVLQCSSFSRKLARSIAQSWTRCTALHVLVAHGSAENLCFEQVVGGCRLTGAVPMILDARSKDFSWTDVVRLCAELPLQPSPHVVLVRYAQLGAEKGTFSVLDAYIQSTEGRPLKPRTEESRAPLSYPILLVLISESLEREAPTKLTALSPVAPLRCTVPSDRVRAKLVDQLLIQQHDDTQQRWFVSSKILQSDHVASWMTGMTWADVMAFLDKAIRTAVTIANGSRRVLVNGVGRKPVLHEGMLEDALKRFQKEHGNIVTSTRLQPVRWSDVGGLEDAKREVLETIQLPLLHPELFANGVKRRAGILLYGPPGCGKTLLAKAVATELNINFLSVKGPELINQYVGESERNVRNLFQRARDNAPCIVFFDELDALVPARGAKGDAGGAMDRIVAQLLTEVDGVASSGPADSDAQQGDEELSDREIDDSNRSDTWAASRPLRRPRGGAARDVFIIGATNRPDLLDPALLRPGRFDRLCYLGIPSTKEQQRMAVVALTRKFSLAADVSLQEVVEPLEFLYTGADFYALCSDALMAAVDEVVALRRGPHAASTTTEECSGDVEQDDTVVVHQRHFIAARQKLKPSVSPSDLRRYESLKNTMTKQ